MRIQVSEPSIGEQEIAAVTKAMASGWITQGPLVRSFEASFAARFGFGHAVACSSGTAALHLGAAALGLGPGDEVLVPDFGYVATMNAALYVGAKAVPVDADPETWGPSIKSMEEKCTRRTKAIFTAHVYGSPADPTGFIRFANRHSLPVLEDAAEGLGGSHNEIFLGRFGSIGTFSFYGNKIMTTGEGGMATTDDSNLADRMRLLRGQGQGSVRYRHEAMGFNYRMTDVTAALGLAQLGRLDGLLHSRHAVVARYRTNLSNTEIVMLDREGQAPWLVTVLVPENVSRGAVSATLAAEGIDTRPAFVPMHRQPFTVNLGTDADFPVASDLADRGISLPTHPGLSAGDIDEVCETLLVAIR